MKKQVALVGTVPTYHRQVPYRYDTYLFRINRRAGRGTRRRARTGTTWPTGWRRRWGRSCGSSSSSPMTRTSGAGTTSRWGSEIGCFCWGIRILQLLLDPDPDLNQSDLKRYFLNTTLYRYLKNINLIDRYGTYLYKKDQLARTLAKKPLLWIRNYFFGSGSDFSGKFGSGSDLIYQ